MRWIVASTSRSLELERRGDLERLRRREDLERLCRRGDLERLRRRGELERLREPEPRVFFGEGLRELRGDLLRVKLRFCGLERSIGDLERLIGDLDFDRDLREGLFDLLAISVFKKL